MKVNKTYTQNKKISQEQIFFKKQVKVVRPKSTWNAKLKATSS